MIGDSDHTVRTRPAGRAEQARPLLLIAQSGDRIDVHRAARRQVTRRQRNRREHDAGGPPRVDMVDFMPASLMASISRRLIALLSRQHSSRSALVPMTAHPFYTV